MLILHLGKVIHHYTSVLKTVVEDILKHRPDLNNQSNSSVFNVAVQGCGIKTQRILCMLLLRMDIWNLSKNS